MRRPLHPLAPSSRAQLGLLIGALVSGSLALIGCPAPEGTLRDAGGGGTDTGRPSGDGGGTPGCEEGIDMDLDGLDNATECALGLDPNNPDEDGDGLRDGTEVNYPRICVASDPSAQRFPPPSCTADADCEPGEICRGLDPRSPDSDGDGVNDALEDSDGNGIIDPDRGETDPRLIDSDGDGTPDNEEGIAVCRPDGLAMPVLSTLPMGSVQIAFDNEWGTPRPVPAAGGIGFVFDDEASQTAGLAVERPAAADVTAEAEGVESALAAAIPGLTGILVGRSILTHDGHAGITSFYAVDSTTESAATLRDMAASTLAGGAPAASAGTWEIGGTFYFEITTVLRTSSSGGSSRVVSLIGVSPSTYFDDPAQETAIRVRDLTNTTGLADNDKTLSFDCQMWVTESNPAADFLWLVDTSGSMSGDQENLGRVAGQFFERMSAAGVDFRVGVFDADVGTPLDLETPGFAFINGTDADGVQQLQYQVTSLQYMGMAADTRVPYPRDVNGEEPVGRGVQVVEEFERYAEMGSTDPNRTLRSDVQIVAFFVTDEPGSNDDGRFFATDTARWGGTPEARIMSAIDFYGTREILSFGLIADYMNACPAQRDFPKCTILGTGGAFIPITTAEVEEVAIAMDRIVEAVAGAASTYIFETLPISATIRVRVDGVEVPRSRADGFDYDGASNSIIFRGPTYRPSIGSEVVVSYRVWDRGVG